MTQSEFNNRLVDILGGDGFFLRDGIWQEELFDMQAKLGDLICEAANSDSNVPLAKVFIKKCSKTFKTK